MARKKKGSNLSIGKIRGALYKAIHVLGDVSATGIISAFHSYLSLLLRAA